ncbi:MAG: hypothetical protein E7438_02850 [Ruminococcaceae bacterium]|nr:hypothetical protein [Oscillospiraceae bacterium]
MYNRYIPQPDGSFRRSRVEDHRPQPPAPKPESCPPTPPPCSEAPPCPNPDKPRPPKTGHCDSGTGFLQKLLPKDFDTGDLIVILLLLLMAGDCEEDRSTALLTLALYLIL